MGVQKTCFIGKCSNYASLFLNVKSWFENNMPDFFDSISCNVYSEGTTDELPVPEISFTKNNKVLYTFKAIINGTYNRSLLVLRSYTSSHTGYYESNNTGGTNDYDNHFYNFIGYIFKINNNSVGFSICNITDVVSYANISQGTIIFAKTKKNNIGVIRPSTVFRNMSPVPTGATTSGTNYLCTTTIDTTTNEYYHDNMTYQQSTGHMTVAHPIDVVGDDDYIPNAYYIPITTAKLDWYNDGYLYNGERKFYFNGKIAIEIIE
jgi:hypothetical protein